MGKFKTNVLLKNIIGKDLINNDNIAILELVKNSYDAHSKFVEIYFQNLKSNDDHFIDEQQKITERTSKLIIKDVGVGMDLKDITDKWLNIAYSDKKEKKEFMGRVLAGNKGVGRFSCDRLGEYLDLYTKKKNGDLVHVSIDWKKFEIENNKDLMIQDIDISVKIIKDKGFKTKSGIRLIGHGTILEISKLRSSWATEGKKNKDEWNVEKLLDFRRYLEKFINPNKELKRGLFSLEVVANEFIGEDKRQSKENRVNGRVKNRIFEELDFHTTSIEASIDETGKTITTVLKNKGSEIFKLSEKNVFFPLLKNVEVNLFFLNTYSKIYFKRQTGMHSVDFGSVFLFINGFRIPPYGDIGDDWLGLEKRKGQGYARYLGTRELIGKIEVFDSVNQFRVVSSREGIVRDENFEQLAGKHDADSFFYKTLKRLEKYVVEGLEWDQTAERPRILEQKVLNTKNWTEKKEDFKEEQDIKDRRAIGIINSIIDVNPNDVESLAINDELIEKLLEEEKEKTKSTFTAFMKYDPSILDKKTSVAFKKIKELLEKQEKEIKREKKNREVLEDSKKTDLEKIKNLVLEKEKFQSQNLFLKSISSLELDHVVFLHHHIGIAADIIDKHIKNLFKAINAGDRIDPEKLSATLEKISLETKKIISTTKFATKANFDLESSVLKNDLVVFIKEYIGNVCEGLYQTVNKKNLKFSLNIEKDCQFIFEFRPIEISMLIDNLISNSIKAKAELIEVSLWLNKDDLEIYFKDDGNGIPSVVLDKLFEKGMSTTEGSGLGLFHVQQIIKSMNGKIEAETSKGKGSIFKIRLSK